MSNLSTCSQCGHKTGEHLKLWQIIEWCATGEYVAGDTFINGLGQEIYFDGEGIQGLSKVDIKSDWQYVNTAEKVVTQTWSKTQRLAV